MLKPILTLLATGCFVFFSNCSKDSPEPIETVQNYLTSGTWKISNVTVDGVSSTQFTGMTLSFTSTTYNAVNGGVVWPSTGTWAFSDTVGKVFKRNDDVSVTIDNISETSLVLSLQWNKSTLGGGRVKSIAGKHTFSFTK